MIVGSAIVLALIPIYIPPSHLTVSYQDKTRSFQSVSQFSTISKRSITSYVDPVDSTSFPVLQQFIRATLTHWTKLPMSVQIIIDEAYVDNSNQKLFMLGKYVFSSFCKEACQNKAMDSILQIQGYTQTLHNLSISNLNENIGFNVNKNFKNVNLLSLSFVENQLQDPTDFIFGMHLESNLGPQRKRRQIQNTGEQESLYKLIQQMLSLTNKVKNVPFIIVDSRFTQMIIDSQLIVTVRMQYPIYCSPLCLEESVTDLYTTLLGYGKINESTYTRGNAKYRINKLDMDGIGNSVPLSLFTLSYSTENTTNITDGPITDEASLANIKNGIKDCLNSTIDIDVIKASFTSLENSSQNHNRRRSIIQYVLIVVIRFIVVFSTCDRHCQQNTFIPILRNIRQTAQPFPINNNIILALRSIIYTFGKQNPTLIITTTAAPTTTTASGTSATPYRLTTIDTTQITIVGNLTTPEHNITPSGSTTGHTATASMAGESIATEVTSASVSTTGHTATASMTGESTATEVTSASVSTTGHTATASVAGQSTATEVTSASASTTIGASNTP
ncbi:unnamed protein product [Rotaria socialis]